MPQPGARSARHASKTPPDYLTRARPGDRNSEWVTHASLAEARTEIESLIGGGTAAVNGGLRRFRTR